MSQGWGGEVLRTSYQELVVEGRMPVPRPVGERVAWLLGESARWSTFAEASTGEAVLLQDAEVRTALGLAAHAAASLERARLRLAREAAQRGLHRLDGFGLVDWLALRCPELAAAGVQDLARVALAAQEPVHGPLVQGVLGGGMPLARAARLHRALVRVRRAVPPQEYAAAVQLLADAGCNPLFEDADVARVVAELLRRCLPEADHEARRRSRHALREVHESSLADGSVRRIIVTFGDDADYEAVRAILRSPLAAPASREEREATGEPDLRTAGNRRYDALMTVLRRGVAGSKGQPTTAKAVLVVTLDLETLRRQLDDGGAGRPGCAATLDGGTVSAESVRRLACEADVVPMVLGGPSEIVDQGVRTRLVTPGQRLRLAARDQGCTVPGCSVPATWCDAHHVVPWARGGRSDLSNYALLCPRHHTWVHDRRLTATVSGLGVRWHLR